MKSKASKLMVIAVLSLFTVMSLFVNSIPTPFTVAQPALPPPICIRDDGTIEGTDALQRYGNVYIFLKDIVGNIEIQKDDIVLFGNGFKLSTPPTDYRTFWNVFYSPAIKIEHKENITLQNITFDICYTGMLVESCSKILIVDNIVTNYSGSIVLSSSTNCSIIGNGFYGNYDVGLYISNSSTYIAYNNFTGNQATRYSYAGLSGFIRESTITQNSFSNCWIGLSFNHESKNNKISENNFIDNEMGVYFYPPSADRGINNLLLHNYWEDNRRDVGNADKYNPVDSKPLSSPVSTFTETYPYPMDMQTITDLNSALTDAQTNTVLPDSSPTATTFPKVLIVVSVLISTVIVIGGLLIYFKKHKHQHT